MPAPIPLTSDKMPFVVMLFGFPSGVLIVFGLVMSMGVFETFRSLQRGAPETAIRCNNSIPVVCDEYSVRHDAIMRALIAAMLFVIGAALWPIGFRHRHVILDATDVRITWGKMFPLPLHRYAASEIENMRITKEARYAVSPIPGTSINRVARMPDRWRMRATYRNRSINLGSYTNKFEAQRAKEIIKSATEDPESGVYHYGKS